jgi:hypothetical protein
MANEMSKKGKVIFARIGIHNPEVFRAGLTGAPPLLLFSIVDLIEGEGLIIGNKV